MTLGGADMLETPRRLSELHRDWVVSDAFQADIWARTASLSGGPHRDARVNTHELFTRRASGRPQG